MPSSSPWLVSTAPSLSKSPTAVASSLPTMPRSSAFPPRNHVPFAWVSTAVTVVGLGSGLGVGVGLGAGLGLGFGFGDGVDVGFGSGAVAVVDLVPRRLRRT